MRATTKFSRLLCGGVFAAFSLGAADAQWLTLPTAEDLTAAYPAGERQAGVLGRIELSCVVQPDGKLLNCNVAAETPMGHDFGPAALSLTPKFQIDAGNPAGRKMIGKRIRIPIRFGTASGQPPLRAARFKDPGSYAYYAPAGPYWPDRASRMNASGFVAVNCFVADDQSLRDCHVAAEDGAEFGFADSVMKMAEQRFMTAAPLEPGAAAPPGNIWRFEVTFPARGMRRR